MGCIWKVSLVKSSVLTSMVSLKVSISSPLFMSKAKFKSLGERVSSSKVVTGKASLSEIPTTWLSYMSATRSSVKLICVVEAFLNRLSSRLILFRSNSVKKILTVSPLVLLTWPSVSV